MWDMVSEWLQVQEATTLLIVILVAIGLLVLFFAAVLPSKEKAAVAIFSRMGEGGGIMEIKLPEKWDPQSLVPMFQRYREQDKSDALTYLVDSIKGRFITKQDVKTSRVVAEFLASQLEEIRHFKEIQKEHIDIGFLKKESEIRNLELELRRQEAENAMADNAALAELRRKVKELDERLKLAEIEKKIAELNAPPPPKVSRKEKRWQLEKELEDLKERWAAKRFQITKGLPDESLTEDQMDEKIFWENKYDTRRREIANKLEKYL